jgi:hypothetical protein
LPNPKQAHFGVDDVTAGEGFIQFQITDDVTRVVAERFRWRSWDAPRRRIQLGVSDLKIEHGVDLHGDVVLGDKGWGGKIHHLLLQETTLACAPEGDFEWMPTPQTA